MMLRWSRLRWGLLLAAILAAHVALWRSPETTAEGALRLTLLNAGVWAIVLLPAVGVSMWARAHRGRGGAVPARQGREADGSGS